ncbi:ABC transporter ATP-binding protein [Silvibacterium dinghuense]|uniref:ATP-binding cassette domain-containing protein n=1 Tax=Silvibacterium dinghuense TaxID=1560006 RepID=A0A4Q1SG87_9BACT|nr:ATP-binding cassette domain-containing protein [Silvibacterium dinghuense]RXS96548.1 ATP-binding cassette domain-containing protein [Silvibacterium dinghuense]GGG91668.1 ABC transporter ATP-binding protein [Silvibacterium dinghuense]
MSTVVHLDRISKSYENKVAVKELSLRIDAGMMFGLLGPNGAGKTSSIRMMIGITMPDSGTVNLFGKPFTRESLRRVGYLPEERGLYKKMKVMEQLVFMGQLRGLEPAVAARRAHEWCERLQILDAAQKKTEELSKGMQQKIQFIATLLHEPELIIMDEPFSGLDPVNATLLQDTLIELKKAGRAILFSTHRMDQVEKMCDAICLVHGGEAVLSGSMREVKSRYERDRVEIVYTGDNSFLQHPAIASYKDYGGQVEITLHPHADAQQLLCAAVERATLYRFELKEPSLEEIFIRTVGEQVRA